MFDNRWTVVITTLVLTSTIVTARFGVDDGERDLRQLSVDELNEMCNDERRVCAERAVRGECYGASIRARALQRSCSCACGHVLHERIQTCCKTVGDSEMKHCLPLCRFGRDDHQHL